jgi:hypothetical protein
MVNQDTQRMGEANRYRQLISSRASSQSCEWPILADNQLNITKGVPDRTAFEGSVPIIG